MTKTAPSSVSDSSWPSHDQEARLLAELLRTSRLALLFAEDGTDKTALLKKELDPLLRRRDSDRAKPSAARESAVVVPFPDRRARLSSQGSRRRGEMVIYFDAWNEAPLAALHARIQEATCTEAAEKAAAPRSLADIFRDLSSRLDLNFIVLLDRFEEFLRAPPQRDDIVRFTNELVDVINQPRLPANFLISVNDEARPRLASLRSRIPGFDDCSLKLTRPPALKAPTPLHPALRGSEVMKPVPTLTDPVTPPASAAAMMAPASAPVVARVPASASASRGSVVPEAKRPRPPTLPRVPVSTEDVYAFIEATLVHTATEVASEPFLAGKPVPRMPANDRSVAARSTRTRQQAPDVSSPAEGGRPPRDAGVAPPDPATSVPPAQTRGITLHDAVEWVERHLLPKAKPTP